MRRHLEVQAGREFWDTHRRSFSDRQDTMCKRSFRRGFQARPMSSYFKFASRRTLPGFPGFGFYQCPALFTRSDEGDCGHSGAAQPDFSPLERLVRQFLNAIEQMSIENNLWIVEAGRISSISQKVMRAKRNSSIVQSF